MQTPVHTTSIASQQSLLPLWVAGLYREAQASLRAQLLERLMRPLGLLGLVGVADGAFAALRQRHGWKSADITAEDTQLIDADQVFQLAAYLQERVPEGFALVADLLSREKAALATVSGVLLWQALRPIAGA